MSIVLTHSQALLTPKQTAFIQSIFGPRCEVAITARGLEVSTTYSQALKVVRRAFGPTAHIHQQEVAGQKETQVRIGHGKQAMVQGGIVGENWARLLGMALLGKDFQE